MKDDFRLPDKVVLANADQRLPLDLGTELGIELLAEHAKKRLRTVTLAVIQLSEDLWTANDMPNYREEFVASVFVDGVADDPAADSTPTNISRLFERIAPQARYRTPFTEVCQINLYLGADEQDFLLCDAIPQWIASLRQSVFQHWFFVRYDDGYPHLRLRVFGDIGKARDILFETTAFARALAAVGTIDRFTIGTYQPEFERYGGTSMMRAAEKVFSESSDAVAASIRELISDRATEAIVSLTPYVLAAADLSLLLGRGDLQKIALPRDLAKRRRLAEDGARQNALYQALLRYLSQFRETHGPAATRYLWHDLAHMHFNRCGLSREAENLARRREVATRSRIVQSRCHG